MDGFGFDRLVDAKRPMVIKLGFDDERFCRLGSHMQERYKTFITQSRRSSKFHIELKTYLVAGWKHDSADLGMDHASTFERGNV